MANEQNLKPCEYKLSQEEQKKGGINSGKARRERKKMRETLEILMNMPLDSKKVAELENIKGFKNLKGKNLTVQDAIMIAQAQKAMKGDLGSASFIRDTIGEKPTDSVNVSGEVKNPFAELSADDLKKLIDG